MKRKYTGVTVSREVNCSSSHDYFADVRLHTVDDRSAAVHFVIAWRDGFAGNSYLHLPKYAVGMIMGRLVDMYQAGGLRVYEYNQEGVKRYEGLRYHHDEALASCLGISG